MKKLIPLLVFIAVVLLTWGSFATAHAQDSTKEEKPTFYRLTPGVYVNGWPRFTITYPKDWVEHPTLAGGLFSAKTPGPALGAELGITPVSIPPPFLDKFSDFVVFWFRTTTDKDVTVVSDRPSRLRDGTPAQELELQMVKNGKPYNWLGVGTKKGNMWINVNVGSFLGKIGEDLRAIPYSLQYEPGKDEPAKVPPDVQEFLDRWCSAIVAHDVGKLMTYYSDRFLNSGSKKGNLEGFWKQYIGSITSHETVIIELVLAGDKAYLAGFINANTGKWPLQGTIIKESGEWKWYGNQRDVSP